MKSRLLPAIVALILLPVFHSTDLYAGRYPTLSKNGLIDEVDSPAIPKEKSQKVETNQSVEAEPFSADKIFKPGIIVILLDPISQDFSNLSYNYPGPSEMGVRDEDEYSHITYSRFGIGLGTFITNRVLFELAFNLLILHTKQIGDAIDESYHTFNSFELNGGLYYFQPVWNRLFIDIGANFKTLENKNALDSDFSLGLGANVDLGVFLTSELAFSAGFYYEHVFSNQNILGFRTTFSLYFPLKKQR